MGLKKGQINNPKGRPKGSKNVATKEIKDMTLNALTKAGTSGFFFCGIIELVVAYSSLI